MGSTTVRGAIKNLTGSSLVYGVGSISLKGISFFLLPLYTRFLTPSDYGIIGLTTTITIVLGFIYPLGLHGALAKLYFGDQDESARRASVGTLWIGILFSAASMTVLLDRTGETITPLIFREIPFAPFIRLAIWTAFFNTFSLLPLGLLQIRERPIPYVVLTASGALLSIGLIVWLVVFQELGAYGYLSAVFIASAIMAVPFIAVLLRQIALAIRWDILKTALVYSLPLVPHGLAGWVLDLSDRTILEHYVPFSDLGLYSLGYQIGTLVNIVASAINYAWVPFVFKTVAEQGQAASQQFARLATYYVFFLCWVTLGLSLFTRELLLVLTAPAFHDAARVVPWVVGGLLFNGLYYIPINFLFVKGTTGLIPVVTMTAGIANIALNLWLVPQYGIVAAAWSTFFSYGLMLIMAWTAARGAYPISYEYRRLAKIALACACIIVAATLWQPADLLPSIAAKSTLLLLLPILLWVFRFFTSAEVEFAKQMVPVWARR